MPRIVTVTSAVGAADVACPLAQLELYRFVYVAEGPACIAMGKKSAATSGRRGDSKCIREIPALVAAPWTDITRLLEDDVEEEW